MKGKAAGKELGKMLKSVRFKLGAISVLFVILLAGAVTSTYLFVESQRVDALVIDFAGRQRMLSQKMLNEVLCVQRGLEIQKYQEQLSKTVKIFDSSLEALLKGGSVSGDDGEVVKIPRIKDASILLL